ncbi:MAG: TolC family protein [Pirellulaceae bacterium]
MRFNSTLVSLPAIASMRHLLGVALITGTLLACSGCRLPALCCAKPGPSLPADFGGVTSVDNSAMLGIDEFFADPNLTQLIVEGIDRNQELRIRNQEIRIAANEIRARSGAYLPVVSAGLLGGFDKSSRYTPLGAAEDQLTFPVAGSFPDPLTNTRVEADLSWKIDIWREFRNARDAARQRYAKAIEARNYLITQIVAETAENYYRLPALDKRLEFLNQTIEIQKQSLDVAIAQKEAGTGDELAVQRFLAEVRKNESERSIVRQEIIETENRINFLVGRYPQPVERTPWDVVGLGARVLNVGIPAELLQNRRDIRAAEREIAAAGLDVLVARAHFYPSLDIRAGIGFEAFDPEFLFNPAAMIGGAAGELVAPVINRRAIQAEYLNANAEQLKAIYEYQQTVLNAFIEVVNRLNEVENYRQSVAIKQEQVAALEQSVDAAGYLWQFVEGEYIDVLFSQRDLLEARIALLEDKQQQLSATVQAYQALGGGFLLDSSGTPLPELFRGPLSYPSQELIFLPEEDEAPARKNHCPRSNRCR